VANPAFRAVIIAPTPELALQIHSDITRLLHNPQNPEHYKDYAQVVVGGPAANRSYGGEWEETAGESVDAQVQRLVRNAPTILIGTPKRLVNVLKHPDFPTKLLRYAVRCCSPHKLASLVLLVAACSAVEHIIVDEVDNVVLPVPRRIKGDATSDKEKERLRKHPKAGMKLLRHLIHHNPNAQLTFASATINSQIRSEVHVHDW
jgi:hypothetical protein